VAAVTAVLARYPRDIIKSVTHPVTGLPTKLKFLPAVAEVFEACEALMVARREQAARQKRVAQQLAERAEFERRNPVYARDSDEARAVLRLHEIVGRTSAFYQIFRRPDGTVTYPKPMTARLAALASAPADQASWVVLSRQQAGAWEAFLRSIFDRGLVRLKLTEGSKAPWCWPPSVDGRIYDDPNGVPPLSDDEISAIETEGGRG
jgi:hypothetical protein